MQVGAYLTPVGKPAVNTAAGSAVRIQAAIVDDDLPSCPAAARCGETPAGSP